MRGILLDISPLRYDREYRILWTGQLFGSIGAYVTQAALLYQVYVITGSTLGVAALTLFQLVPILVFVLGAGAIVDVVDRRRVLLVTQTGLLLCTLALMVLSFIGDPPVIALYLVAFAAAALNSADFPARSSAVPRLVPPHRLAAAIALNQLNHKAGSVIGPALGGLLIATIGLAGAYAADAITFTVSLTTLILLRPIPPLAAAMRPGIAAIRAGITYAVRRRVILASFVIDLDAMVLAMPTALFPAMALDVFHVGPAGYGILTAAPAVGALIGAFLSGWVAGVRRTGRAIIIAVIVWGVAITAFALATFSFALALVFLAIAGAADVFSAVLRSTLVQLETPDELRGRVSSLHTLAVTSGPRLGDIRAATVAAAIGAQASAVSGGILCLLGVAAVVRAFPELVVHRIHTSEHHPPPVLAPLEDL